MNATPLQPFPDDWRRAVFVAAHPDDTERGAGAAAAAWTGTGKCVHYVVVTRSEAGIADLDPSLAGPLPESEDLELIGSEAA